MKKIVAGNMKPEYSVWKDTVDIITDVPQVITKDTVVKGNDCIDIMIENIAPAGGAIVVLYGEKELPVGSMPFSFGGHLQGRRKDNIPITFTGAGAKRCLVWRTRAYKDVGQCNK